MWQSIRRGLENLASRRGRHPSDLMNGSGAVILLGAAGYALYNLYVCISYGMVYRHVRGPLGGSRWITYADDPMNFVMWTFVYSLPLWIAAAGLGYLGWKKHAR